MVIKEKQVFEPQWQPKEPILFRPEEAQRIKSVIDSVEGNGSKHLVIIGRSGSGKTLMIRHLTEKLVLTGKVHFLTVPENATEMQVLVSLANDMRVTVRSRSAMAWKQAIGENIKIYGNNILFVIDEADKLVKNAGDDIFYHFGEWGVSSILISNDDSIRDLASERTKSRLGGMSCVSFKPYNAYELSAILTQRAIAGLEEGSWTPEFINVLAAYCAQRHGDARGAINHLHACALLAEERGQQMLGQELIREAEELSEVSDAMRKIDLLPPMSKLALRAMANLLRKNRWSHCKTVEIAEELELVAKERGMSSVGERRIVDFVWNWKNFGIVESKLASQQSGIGKVVSFRISIDKIEAALKKEGY